ncbi:MAG: hypothetical protein IPG04_07915 [Polyangiaceae bacterium]|nr:hypothetical protein [Polyangiaceae bacterium]
MGTSSGSGRAQANKQRATKSITLRQPSTDRLALDISTSWNGVESLRWASLAWLLLVPAWGCSASAPSPEAVTPKAGGSMEVSSAQHISDAEAELTLAEQTLEQVFSPKVTDPQPLGRSDPPIPPSQPSATPSQLDTGTAASRCELACKALGSMRRSSEYVCRLAGPADPRCELARARVVKAEGRVSSAGCRCEATPG